jgi:hypothetical protein
MKYYGERLVVLWLEQYNNGFHPSKIQWIVHQEQKIYFFSGFICYYKINQGYNGLFIFF